jgi:hypothetical protein
MGGELMTTAQMRELLGDELGPSAPLWVDMVRVPPSGTWARRRGGSLRRGRGLAGRARLRLDRATTRELRDEAERLTALQR